MNMINENEKLVKTVFTNVEISPLVFDLYCTLRDIKKMNTVESIYMNKTAYKFELYIFYQKEDFAVEDEIIKNITNFEENYQYFPEVFIYPLDMIDGKELVLPTSAEEV